MRGNWRSVCAPVAGVALCIVVSAMLLGIAVKAFAQANSPQPPATIFGTYLGAGCPNPAPPDCLLTDARDRVAITRNSNGTTTASVRLVFDQGFLCHVKGEASWMEDHFLIRADGMDATKPCELVLQFDGQALRLRDRGGRCREVYCGAGGAFDGARFKKVQRRKKKPVPQAEMRDGRSL